MPWPKKITVSSAYCKIDSPSSIRCGIISLIRPSYLALFKIITNVSVTILNKIWDKGSPCLTPRSTEKKGVYELPKVRHDLPTAKNLEINLINLSGKRNLPRNEIKSQRLFQSQLQEDKSWDNEREQTQ